MARKNLKRTRRSRKQRGGDSAAYTFGAAVAPGAPYASEVIAQEACGAAARPGFIQSPAVGTGGLPGFAGGGRRRGRRATRRNRKQRGGRYTFDVAAATGGPNPFVPVSRIACEGGQVDTSPPGAAPNPVPASLQAGGAGIALTGSGVSGAVDTAAYYAPTAGYGNTASSWVSSAGVPSLIQVPYEARAMNPACVKTGGGRRRNRRSLKKKVQRKRRRSLRR